MRSCPEVATYFAAFRRYVLEPRAMVDVASPTSALGEHGEGFPGFLDRLQNKAPDAFEALQDQVRAAFPRVRYVRTPAAGSDKRELAIVERGSTKPIFGPQLSDGLLLLIGYLALAFSPHEAPSMLMLDEPEMGLHIDRSAALVDLLRGLSQGRFGHPVQVIITTHSPDIVDFLEPEELVVFERDDRGVHAQRLAEVKDIKKRFRGYNLGEYWSSYGEVGLLRGEAK
jgi:predicted ATPase